MPPRRPLRATLPLALAVLASACQSYEAGMHEFCDARENCGASCLEAPPDMQSTHTARFMDSRIKNMRVRAMLRELDNLDSNARVELMRTHAAEAGIEHCELAEHSARVVEELEGK